MVQPPAIPDHTLLRVIGRGSYGEVWLARNVMGTLRAVKLVRRDAFDSDRPYLREFEGIRRCEPVSRAHDGLIDILHMGRSDEEGWFYYVMELADPADSADLPDQSAYRPATLAARLAPGKMLDITECLHIADSLAGALAFLHEQGLIHRDVKPSNVLYAGGVPKLGDIGLVAEAGSSRSFVGTEGFVPQEGPGTERADIYALGKVLYEALTGMDRSKFPLLPAEWRGAYDFDQRVELNEIVLRACEGPRDRRYATAREMLADVALVASGRSVKELRGMEGRLRLLKWAGAAAGAVAIAALGVSWIGKRQADRERELRFRAEQAEAESLHERCAAMLGQVRAARRDASAGAVTAALASARLLAALQPSPELRDEVAFLLGRSDIVPREDLRVPAGGRPCAVHPGTGSVVIAEPGAGDHLTLHFSTAGSGGKARAVKVQNPPPNFLWPEFSPDGKRVLLLGWWGAGTVIDTASGEELAVIGAGTDLTSLLRWCGTGGARLVRRSSGGALAFYTVPGGGRSLSPPVDWPVQRHRVPFAPAPAPDGKTILLVHSGSAPKDVLARVREVLQPGEPEPNGAAALVDCETGRILWKVEGPDDQNVAWRADGTRLALRAGGRIYIHEAATGAIAAAVPQRVYNGGTRISFLGSRDTLAFSTWSHSGWYEAALDRFSPGLPCSPVHYDQPSQLLWSAERSGISAAQWRPSAVLRTVESRASDRHGVRLAFSPDGAILLVSNEFDFRGVDAAARDKPPVILAARGAASVSFPGGEVVEFHSRAGIHRTAWHGSMPDRLPPPEKPDWQTGGGADFISCSADGRTLAMGSPRRVMVLRDGAARDFPTGDSGNPVSLTADGRWFALGSQHDGTVRVWDLASADEAPAHVQQGAGSCVPAFNADGTELICAMQDANLVLRTGTWEVRHRLPRRGGGIMGFPGFSRDGRRAVLSAEHNRLEIRDARSWRLLYRLTSPLEEQIGRTLLSPDGRFLAAVGARQEVYLWDLPALERSLREFNLMTE